MMENPVEQLSKLQYRGKGKKTPIPVFGATQELATKVKALKPEQATKLLKYKEHIQKNPEKTMEQLYKEHYPNFDDEIIPLAQAMSLRYAGGLKKKSTRIKKGVLKTDVGEEDVRLARPDMQAFFDPDPVSSIDYTKILKNYPTKIKKQLLKQTPIYKYITENIQPNKSYTPEQMEQIKKELISIEPNIETNPKFKESFKNLFLPSSVKNDPRANPLNIQGQTSAIFDVNKQMQEQLISEVSAPQAPSENIGSGAVVMDGDRGFVTVIPHDMTDPENPTTNPYRGSTAIDPTKFDGMIPPKPEDDQVPEAEKKDNGEVINSAAKPIKNSLEDKYEHEGQPQPKKAVLKNKTKVENSAISKELESYITQAQTEQADANAEVQRSDDKLIGDRYRVGLAPQQSRAAADLILKPQATIKKSINTFSNLNWVYSRQNSFLGNASSLKKMDDIEQKMRFGTVYVPIVRQPCSRLTDTLKNKKFLSTLSDPLQPQSDADTETLLKSTSTGSADLNDHHAPRTFIQPPNMGKIAGMDSKYQSFNKVQLFNKIGDMSILRNTNRSNTLRDNLHYPDIKRDLKTDKLIFS